MEKQEQLEIWDEYVKGEFIKYTDVKSPKDAFVCVDIETAEKDGVKKLRLTLERKDLKWKFDVNKTNTMKLAKTLSSPRDVIGRSIYFDIVKVRNPQINKIVDGLLINKVV